MANPKTYTNPNHAVYEQNNPYAGPIGLSHGAATVNGQPIIAVHRNADGSLTGVSENGATVELGEPNAQGHVVVS